MNTRIALLALLALLLALAACGGGGGDTTTAPGQEAAPATAAPVAAGDPVAGEALYNTNCASCHAPDGTGVPGLGKDLTTGEFIAAHSDEELVDFIKVGRGPTDPDNTTGIAMPPKGGNPALTDDQIRDIVAWIRTVHTE
jgi:mono/diheme cytochrome c family protein